MKKILLICFCLGLLLLAGQTALATCTIDPQPTKPAGCTATDCGSAGWCGCDGGTTQGFACMDATVGTDCKPSLCPGAASNQCCKPKTTCDPANCKTSCTGTFVPDSSKSASTCTDPAKKVCCKVGGTGTTTPTPGATGGKTGGSSIPLAPLSPVGDVDIQTLIGYIIKGVLGVVGSIALLMFVYGGFLMLVSQGDTAKVKKGKDTLVWATAGLAVIFGSYVFVSFILDALSKAGT